METVFSIICILSISITKGEDWIKHDRVEPVPQVNTEILTVKLDEVINKYRQLDTSFQNVVKSNADLQATIVYQASRIEQLQTIAEIVPRLVSEIEGLKSKTRLAEHTANDLIDSVVQMRSLSLNKRKLVTHDDWIKKIDREMIINIRNEFKQNTVLQKKLRDFDSYQDEDDDDDEEEEEIESDTIQMISNALAKLVTEEKQSLNKRVTLKSLHTPPDKQGEYNKAAEENKISDQMSSALMSLTRAKSSSKKKLAFSLIRTAPLLGNKSQPQIVTFDHDTVKKGKGINTAMGIFTCEIPGIYHFSYTMRTYDGKHVGVALMLNNEPVVAMTTDASERKVMQSQSVMLTLAVGDEVWIMLGPHDDFAIFGNEFNYNTFNGFLLYPGSAK